MNCEKQICTICRLLVEVRANAADSQADLMLLAIPPQSPAISIQPFTPLRFWQHPKFTPRTEVFWIQQNHLVVFPQMVQIHHGLFQTLAPKPHLSGLSLD